MDYKKLEEALKLIKKTCNDCSNCEKCPFGDNYGECLIQVEPNDWNIVDEQMIRLMK